MAKHHLNRRTLQIGSAEDPSHLELSVLLTVPLQALPSRVWLIAGSVGMHKRLAGGRELWVEYCRD